MSPKSPYPRRIAATGSAAETTTSVLAGVQEEQLTFLRGALANPYQMSAAEQFGGGSGDRPQE